MATKKQIAANRRNAKKCTGPKTPEGKAASSMNVLRHGLRARTVVLPGESQEEFDKIFAGLQDLYQPQNVAEQYLVDQAVIAQWMLVRAEVYQAKSAKESPSADARIAVFSRMTLVTGRLDRAYNKAYEKLERIKAAREKQPEQPKQPSPKEPSNEKQSEKQSKDQKAENERGGPNLDVFWVDSKTGKRDYLLRRRDGKDLPPDKSPTPE